MAIYKNSFGFTNSLADRFDEAVEYLSKVDLVKDGVCIYTKEEMDLFYKLESIVFNANGSFFHEIWFGIVEVTTKEDLSKSEIILLEKFMSEQVNKGFGEDFEHVFNSKIDIDVNGNVFDKYPTENELDDAAEILAKWCLYTNCVNCKDKCKFYRQAVNAGYDISEDDCPGIDTLIEYYAIGI